MKTFSTVHAIARNKEGEYLILQRATHRTSPGEWNFITGYIKEKEAAEDAAIRELKEETNLEGEIVGVSEPWWGDRGDRRLIVVSVLLEIKNPETLKIDAEESQAYQWVRLTDDIVQTSMVMKKSLLQLDIS